jgi:hypothetical protein
MNLDRINQDVIRIVDKNSKDNSVKQKKQRKKNYQKCSDI